MSNSELRRLPVLSILPHPDNPRTDLGDLSALAVDIRDNGLIEPLVVAPGSWGKRAGQCRDCRAIVDRDQGRLVEHRTGGAWCPGGSELARDEWLVLAGHRRLAASRLAGLHEVPCVPRFDLRTRAEQIALMLRENSHRQNLTPVEEARGYEQLTLEGLTSTRIAHLVKAPKKVVDRRLALTRLPAQARDRLQAGLMTLEDAEALLALPPEQAARVAGSVGTRAFRQDLARERTGSSDPEVIVAELRAEFLRPFLAGARRPSKTDLPGVRRAAVTVLAGSLPTRTSKAWRRVLGADPGTVDPDRALVGLAAAVAGHPDDLMAALGYEPAPIEESL